jgi:hypothetical protein
MSDEFSIFGNLPRRRRRDDNDDERSSRVRALLTTLNFVPEGPMRPRPSGVGGPSVNQGTGPTPPVNSAAPVASGTATVGSTLSCTTGTWTNSPTSYAYQWLQNGVSISGATSSTYVVATADAGTSIRCLVTATNSSGSGSATSNALAIAALPSAPSNTVAPVVSGTATVGSTLSCTTGTWTNSPTSYAYQWLRGGLSISGATSATYLLVAADGGTSVSCRVTATNAAGNTSIASNALAVLGIPANTTAPVVSGTLTVGSTLSCTTGTWTNSPTYAYQWQRGGANISGATSSTYVTVSADGGTSVGCVVTATNASGSASQASNTLSIAAAHSAQALAYLARTVGGNEGGNGANIATLIDGLVADGVWAKLDALYVLAQQNQTDAVLNLVSASYPLVNTATFTAYRGFSAFLGNGLNTGFNASSAPSPHFTQNNASLSVWAYNTVVATQVQMGTTANLGGTTISVNTGTQFVGYINVAAAGSATGLPSSLFGFFSVDRSTASRSDDYLNGVSFSNNAVGTQAPENANMIIGSRSGGEGLQASTTLSAAHIGASLGASLQLALYNRLRTYMTAVGVP